MGVLLAVVFIVVPILELAVLIEVGRQIGAGWTIFLLIAVSVAGAIVAKREGVQVYRRFKAAIRRGDIPSAEVVDGFLVLLGAALLLTPGFITDALGLFLIVPGPRAVIKRALRKGAGLALLRKFPLFAVAGSARGKYAKAKVVKVERTRSQTGPTVEEAPTNAPD